MNDFNIFGVPPQKNRKSIFDVEIKPPQKSTTSKQRDKRRTFSQTQKNEIWSQQNGKCAECGEKLDPRSTEYDHKKPWASGGKTTVKNGRAVCRNCHGKISHNTKLKKVNKKRKTQKQSAFGDNIFKF